MNYMLQTSMHVSERDLMRVCIRRSSSGPLNTLRPRQNIRQNPNNIFKGILLNENVVISIKMSLKFVPINNIPALVHIMAWCRPGLQFPKVYDILIRVGSFKFCIGYNLRRKIWMRSLTTNNWAFHPANNNIVTQIWRLQRISIKIGSVVCFIGYQVNV